MHRAPKSVQTVCEPAASRPPLGGGLTRIMDTMSDPEASVVTIKDLWQSQQAQTDRLAAALGGVERTLERLTGHLDAIDQRNARADKTLTDYETRLRSLERWRYALPISALSAVGAAVAALLQTVHR